MNGQKLSVDHGYPLRLIIPGHAGVRNCKWLKKLTISDEEATSIFQKRDYKLIKAKNWDEVNFDSADPIMTNPINSAISWPMQGEHIEVKKDSPVISIQGWAIGDGFDGAKVKKVEISIDGGKTWKEAKLTF